MTPTSLNTPTQEAFDQFTVVLTRSGVRDALAYILGLSTYRFIGIFRFKNHHANAAVHYDRENPSLGFIEEVSEIATYCCYVRDSKGIFTTANSLMDSRLTNHPARTTVLAYCGIPIMDPEGTLLGTLCHYDTVPRDATQLDLELLLRVATALQQGNHVPPYPESPLQP